MPVMMLHKNPDIYILHDDRESRRDAPWTVQISSKGVLPSTIGWFKTRREAKQARDEYRARYRR
jgi:hypothetical protein